MKTISRRFATMTDEERRGFERQPGRSAAGAEDEAAADEVVGDPRDEDRSGPRKDGRRGE